MTHKEFVEKYQIKNYVIDNGKLIIKQIICLSHNQIKAIPDNAVFKSWANLSHNQIKAIPDTAIFKNGANLSHNQIKAIPDNAVFKSWANLNHNQIKDIPDTAMFKGWINLSHNQIKAIPDTAVFEVYVNLSHNQIKAIPDTAVFEGYVDLSHNQIKAIPDNAVFKSWVDLSHNQIKDIPDTAVFNNEFYLFDHSTSFHDDIKLANKILKGELSFNEIMKIENIEQRRIAYEHVDKSKILQEKGLEIIDERIDNYGNIMKIYSLKTDEYDESFYYLYCICPSTGREYMLETREITCDKAKAKSFGYDELTFDKEW
jgi:hypothetical protein